MVLCEKCKTEEVQTEWDITCSVCNKAAKVPFKPFDNSKGLKCKDCFGASK